MDTKINGFGIKGATTNPNQGETPTNEELSFSGDKANERLLGVVSNLLCLTEDSECKSAAKQLAGKLRDGSNQPLESIKISISRGNNTCTFSLTNDVQDDTSRIRVAKFQNHVLQGEEFFGGSLEDLKEEDLVETWHQACADDQGVLQRLFDQANKGCSLAQRFIAHGYKVGAGSFPHNNAQAFHYYKLAADQGNAIARFECSVMLDRGIGCERDPQMSTTYLSLAAAPEQYLPVAQVFQALKKMEELFALLDLPEPEDSFAALRPYDVFNGANTVVESEHDKKVQDALREQLEILQDWRHECIDADYFVVNTEFAEESLGNLQEHIRPFADKNYAPALFQCGMAFIKESCWKSSDASKDMVRQHQELCRKNGMTFLESCADQGYAPALYEIARLNNTDNTPAISQKYPPALADVSDFINREFGKGETLFNKVPSEPGQLIFQYPNIRGSFWSGFNWSGLSSPTNQYFNETKYVKVLYLMKANLYGFKQDQNSPWFS